MLPNLVSYGAEFNSGISAGVSYADNTDPLVLEPVWPFVIMCVNNSTPELLLIREDRHLRVRMMT